MTGAVPPSTSRHEKTILIAEDDPQIASMLRRLFRPVGTVLTATDGTEALALASKYSVDLLLTDVMMPTLNGFSLARQLRLLPGRNKVPIVFLTARDTPDTHLQAIRLGASHIVTKPFSVHELLQRIKRILNAAN